MKRVKKVITWIFGAANNAKGATMVEGHSYKIKTKAGTFWGRLVAKASKTTVLLRDRKGKERVAEVSRSSSVFRIKGKDSK